MISSDVPELLALTLATHPGALDGRRWRSPKRGARIAAAAYVLLFPLV